MSGPADSRGGMTGFRRGGVILFVLAAAFVAALGGLAPSAARAKDGQVTVRAAGTTNASVTVRLAELGGNDINNRNYTLGSGPVTISGHSLLQVMRAADAESEAIDLDTIPAIEIDRPTGGPITVTGAEMRNPSAFPEGPPVFYEDNGATVFVMPGRGSANSSRYRFNFAPVGITVQSGVTYDVELSASRTRVKVGQAVRFNATVDGQDGGERLTYSWDFGDGRTATTSRGTISHTFRTDGNFSVILGVSGASGAGQSGILIEVGELRQRPDRPQPKPDPPAQQPSDNPGSGGSGNPSGEGGFGTGSGGGTGAFGGGDGGGFPSSPGPAPGPVPPADRPDTARPDRKVPQDGLTTVTGELVNPATASVPVDPSTGLPVESADPAPSGTEQGGFGVPGAVLTLVGVGALLGLGGFAELRIFSRLY